MTSHSLRLAAILVAALAVLVAYVFLSSSGGKTGFLEGMLVVLLPALLDAGAEQQRRVNKRVSRAIADDLSENERPTPVPTGE